MKPIKNRYTGKVMCGSQSLNAVLKKHKKWLRDEDGGERADLTEAISTCVDVITASVTKKNK